MNTRIKLQPNRKSKNIYARELLNVIPCILLLATVFIINNQFTNGIVVGKYYWFYGNMGLFSVFAIAMISVSNRKQQVITIDCLVFIFGIASIFFSHYYNTSESITKQILLILLIILFYYFRLALHSNNNTIYWLTICFIFTGLVSLTWGLLQLYGFKQSQHSLFQLTGSFFNPGPFACYIAVIMSMSFYYTLKYKICYEVKFNFRNIPIYLLCGIAGITFVTSIVVLPATMSRASWMAASGGCGMVLLYYFYKSNKVKVFIINNKKKCILLASTALIIFFVGTLGAYYLKKDSADGRTFIWINTLELIKQNPLGVGIGNYSGSYGHIQAAYFEAGNGSVDEERVAGNPDYAFNEYLQIFAEQGIIVFLLFISIVGYSLYIGIKRRKIAATSSLLALLIAAGASYPFSVLPFLIVLVFLLALIHNGEKGIAIPKYIAVLFAFCGLIIVLQCLYNRYPTYDAYKKWGNISLMYNYGNQKEVVNEYRDIYPLLSDQIKFLFEYAQCLNKSEQYIESNEVLEKAVKISCDPMLYNVMGKNYQAMKQYTVAEQCFLKASYIVPNRIYPYYLMALMYVEAGEIVKAKEVAQIVLTKEPKVQSTAVKEIREEAMRILNL